MIANHATARAVHQERQRDIQRRLRYAAHAVEPGTPRTSLRRRVGRQLIRLGSALESDGPLQLAARR